MQYTWQWRNFSFRMVHAQESENNHSIKTTVLDGGLICKIILNVSQCSVDYICNNYENGWKSSICTSKLEAFVINLISDSLYFAAYFVALEQRFSYIINTTLSKYPLTADDMSKRKLRLS